MANHFECILLKLPDKALDIEALLCAPKPLRHTRVIAVAGPSCRLHADERGWSLVVAASQSDMITTRLHMPAGVGPQPR